jgi:hypothetical protein
VGNGEKRLKWWKAAEAAKSGGGGEKILSEIRSGSLIKERCILAKVSV